MAFASFLGRLLFASIFILSAYQEFNDFGIDGGQQQRLSSQNSTSLHNITIEEHLLFALVGQIKHVVAADIALKGIGGALFIFGSSIGACLLLLHQMIITPILYDFYNYDNEEKEFALLFIKFNQNMALFGALLFFIGMKNSIPKRVLKKKAPKAKNSLETSDA